jgi:hypothetical protein
LSYPYTLTVEATTYNLSLSAPGPQGPPGAGTSVENPADVLYVRCAQDDAVIAVRIVLDQGAYAVEVSQTPEP